MQPTSFPAMWPPGVPVPRIALSDARVPDLVAVAVAWTWPNAPTDMGAGRATTEQLTMLTSQALSVYGFPATEMQAAAFRLGCSVRELTYRGTNGYPLERIYSAQADCQLLRKHDQAIIWQREFRETIDDTLYVNVYSRLPSYHEHAFARESLATLVQRIARSLGSFVQLHTHDLDSYVGKVIVPTGPSQGATDEK